MNIGETIEELIKKVVHETLNKNKEAYLPDNLIETDNLGEVIEKIVILHCRMWYLEDAACLSKTDEELADIKRKVDICFKQKRPKYVEAINRMVDKAIISEKSVIEDSVKFYKSNQ